MRVGIGVLARAPLAGQCKPGLLAAHEPAWVAGLYAAMLRDTLDGLLSVSADDYVVFAPPLVPEPGTDADGGELAAELLARHVPAPWRIVAQPDGDPDARAEHALETLLEEDGAVAVLAVSDAPSFPTAPLADALGAGPDVLVGPTADGGFYVLATRRRDPRLLRGLPWGTPAVLDVMRVRCTDLGARVEELPTWYDVDRPSDVLQLLEELRRHPERAPRTAQYLVTAG